MTHEPNNTAWNRMVIWRGLLAMVFVTAALVTFFGLNGCATGNKGAEINIGRSRTSTTAENIEAGGKVAAGAWDRLFGNKANQEK